VQVFVRVPPTPATGLTISKTILTLSQGASATLTASLTPSHSTAAVTWTSNNANVATVTNTGVVKGVTAGTAMITVKTVDGAKTATCRVTVTQGP